LTLLLVLFFHSLYHLLDSVDDLDLVSTSPQQYPGNVGYLKIERPHPSISSLRARLPTNEPFPPQFSDITPLILLPFHILPRHGLPKRGFFRPSFFGYFLQAPSDKSAAYVNGCLPFSSLTPSFHCCSPKQRSTSLFMEYE